MSTTPFRYEPGPESAVIRRIVRNTNNALDGAFPESVAQFNYLRNSDLATEDTAINRPSASLAASARAGESRQSYGPSKEPEAHENQLKQFDELPTQFLKAANKPGKYYLMAALIIAATACYLLFY